MKTDLSASGTLLKQSPLNREAGQKISQKSPPGISSLKESPDYKVELSGTGVPLSPPPLPVSSAPSLSKLPEPPKKSLKQETEKVLRDSSEIKTDDIQKIKTVSRSLRKPAILFIKGLDLFSSPLKSEGGYAGVGRIAESIEGARLYGWDQKKEIVEAIRKVHPDYPVILVGHSLGGDTAIEIADELDTMKEGFRSIDLLVTIDAVGFSHDIIPQNVKHHLNVFGEKSLFLNDGPHVARRDEKTSVRNILSPLDHTEIDDDKEIQFEIVDLIKKTLSSHEVS